jgi:hypothetical protein
VRPPLPRRPPHDSLERRLSHLDDAAFAAAVRAFLAQNQRLI